MNQAKETTELRKLKKSKVPMACMRFLEFKIQFEMNYKKASFPRSGPHLGIEYRNEGRLNFSVFTWFYIP
jgi:hypothetical protein